MLVQDVVAAAAQAVVDHLLLLGDALVSASADADRTTRSSAKSRTFTGAHATDHGARDCAESRAPRCATQAADGGLAGRAHLLGILTALIKVLLIAGRIVAL